MPISFKCACGRALRVKNELGGRRVRCPSCSSILTVPKLDIEYDAADDSVVDTPSDAEKEPDRDEPEAPAATAITDRPLYRAPASVKKRRPASKRDRKKESRRPRMVFSINAEVASGLVMIVAAIVWFVGGLLWLHRIFFYPPILLIIGIGAIIKGFTAPE